MRPEGVHFYCLKTGPPFKLNAKIVCFVAKRKEDVLLAQCNEYNLSVYFYIKY